jgi:hypothetical protein
MIPCTSASPKGRPWRPRDGGHRIRAQVHPPSVLHDDAEAVAVALVDEGVPELDDLRVAAAIVEARHLPRELEEACLDGGPAAAAAELLDRDDLVAVQAVPRLVDAAEDALAELLQALVPLLDLGRPGGVRRRRG